MRPFLKALNVVIGLTAIVLFSTGLALADVDPDKVAQDMADQAAAASGVAASSEDPSSALGQFPRAEMAPAPVFPSGNAPINTAANTAAAGQAVGTNTYGNSLDFPKVQTPEDEELARKFQWWPTDAQPAPVKDPNRSGYWWWPDQPGVNSTTTAPWGNQGYIYVRKIIFDYKDEVVETPQGPMRPSLVIKRIIRNVRVYFDYDKSDLRDDTIDVLQKALYTLKNNEKADILITGNADLRGSEKYNEKLGARRAASVQEYLAGQGLAAARIRILSRGKLDALAPSNDIVGMQKDRNAQFMIAEVEEVMIPADKADLFEDKQIVEKQEITGQIRVSTKDYVIQSGDTLWDIAKREYGDGKQWKRIYEFNKDVISNPNRPRKGTRIQIPIE